MVTIETMVEDVHSLDTRVTKLEESQPYLKEMLEKNTTTNEKLMETLHSIDMTMVGLNNKMDAQSATMADMQHEFEEANSVVNERISKLKGKVETLEDEGKFNIRMFFKNNLPWIIVILGMGILLASKYFKF